MCGNRCLRTYNAKPGAVCGFSTIATGAVPTDLVRRLHAVSIERSLDIQEMANQCELPKIAARICMKMDGARRPGVDALASIARGKGISADGLPGSKTDEQVQRFCTGDHGLACMAFASKFLADLRAAQERQPTPSSRRIGCLGNQTHGLP